MPSPLSAISSPSFQPVRLAEAAVKPPASSGEAFQNVLNDAVQRVENYRTTADTAIQKFLSGEDEELHKVAIATQQAEISLEMFLQVKNKVVQAYQEIMRMQL
jgi:flagellar hook-basal body complex protein FliE